MQKKRNHPPTACDCKVIHEVIVKNVKHEMPSPERIFDTADFFKVFGDSTRLSILIALGRAEMCGCDICALLNMTQSAVSHQIRVLRQARLVRHRREGKIVYYRLDDAHINDILKRGMEHTAE